MKAGNLIKFIIIVKLISPIMALIYLVCWILQALSPNLFKFFNIFIGFLPKIFDKIFPVETVLMNKLVSMSYVYCACVFALFFYFSNIFIKRLEEIEKNQKNNEIKKRLAKQKETRIRKEAREKKEQAYKSGSEATAYTNYTYANSANTDTSYIDPAPERKTFFGLFEFQLKYYDVYGKDPANLHSLRREFAKITVKKLQESYKNIQFYADERIFFSCNEFSNFRPITKDILTILKTFMQVGLSQSIKVGMLFSYWAGDENSNKEEIFKILNKINELGYLNKIIVSSGVYFRFNKENDRKCMSFDPLGAAKLTNATDDGDMDIDLYSITKVE